MKGTLGSLHNGRLQVGGIIEWELDLVLSNYSKDTATYYKVSKWKLTANGYWLFDVPDRVMVRIYSDVGKGYWEGVGYITSQYQKIFDTLIRSQIEIVGEGILEGKSC